MRIATTRDLGLVIRTRRRDLQWTQDDLATRIGASRHWVLGMERGKASAEVGLVLRALSALGLVLHAGPAPVPGRGLDVDVDAVVVRAKERSR